MTIAPPPPGPINPALFMAPEPTPSEKALYDKFVVEYVRDYNAVEACVRIGFEMVFAVEFAQRFLTKPYVIKAIADHKASVPTEDKKIEEQDRSLVIAGLRELSQNGKGSQRVAALVALGKFRGMDIVPDKSGDALKEIADQFKDLAKNLPD
jgi:hypothetical protein